MKKFYPYFKLLIPVKWRFILAIIAGVIYGAASGLGLPLMTAKVFPLLFKSATEGAVIAVKTDSTESGKISSLLKKKASHIELGTQSNFAFGHLLHQRNTDGSFTPLPPKSHIDTKGSVQLPDQSKIALNDLFAKDNNQYHPIDGNIYLKNNKGDYNLLTSNQDLTPSKWTLFWSVMMLPCVFLIRGVFGYINTYQITYCGNYVLEQIRKKTFSKLQRLDLSFFQKNGTGDLMTRLMTEAARLQQMLTAASNDLIKQPITFLGAVIALVYISIQQKEAVFVLVCLGIIPIVIFPVRRLSKRMLSRMREGAVGEGELGNRVQENLMAIRDVRNFNLEDREIKRFESVLKRFFTMIMKMTKYRSMIPPTVEFITAIGISLAIFFSAQNGLTLEKVLPLIVALYMSYEPLKRMGQLQNQLVLGAVAVERLEGILHAEEGVKDPESPTPLPPLNGGISFDQLTFEYEKGVPALDNVSVEIKPGQVVALVGPSGAGKSTFTHLISRSYEYQKGQLLFDTHNIKEHSLHDIRANVSVVSQDPYLFNESVENNIRMGNLEASSAQIREAARLAHCMDFVERLPKGFDTLVGENTCLPQRRPHPHP